MSDSENSNDPVIRSSMRAGQVFVILGLILVYGVGGYWLIFEIGQDPDTPWFVKFGVPAIVIGFTILFFHGVVSARESGQDRQIHQRRRLTHG